MEKISDDNHPNGKSPTPFSQTYFHGTRADLKIGDLIEAGFSSNFGQRKNAKYIFLTSTLNAAKWGAELSFGDGEGRIYLVEPTGPIEDDPDLTDKKFPGNPTKSYRSTYPFKVVEEVTIWQSHSSEQVKAMKEHLERLKEQGVLDAGDDTILMQEDRFKQFMNSVETIVDENQKFTDVSVLESPDQTKAMIKSITEKDSSGKTYLKLPVEDEEVVENVLKGIGQIFQAIDWSKFGE